jgi:hypothetical protein
MIREVFLPRLPPLITVFQDFVIGSLTSIMPLSPERSAPSSVPQKASPFI